MLAQKTPSPSPPIPNQMPAPLFVLAVFFLFYMTYAPVVRETYVVIDGYRVLLGDVGSVFTFSVSKGRPLFGLWVWMIRQLELAPADLVYVRVVALIFMSLSSYLLVRILLSLGLTIGPALAIGIGSFFLPPFQELAAYGLISIYAAAIFLVLLVSRHYLETKVLPGTVRRFADGIHPPLIIALVVAWNIYQTAALLYWTVLGMYVLSRVRASAFRRANILYASILMNGVIAMLFYCLTTKVLLAVSGTPPDHRGQLALHPFLLYEKLSMFKGMVLAGLNLFWLDVNPWRAGVVILLICVLLADRVTGLLRDCRGPQDTRLGALAVAATFVGTSSVCLVLTITPNLLVKASFYPARVLFALYPMVLCACVMGLMRLISMTIRSDTVAGRCRLLSLTLLVCIGAATASRNVYSYIVHPQSVEYRVLKAKLNRLADPDNAHVARIHVIHPERHEGVSPPLPLSRYPNRGIFGSTSIGVTWFIRDIVTVALKDLGIPRRYTISFARPEDKAPASATVYIVNMADLQQYR